MTTGAPTLPIVVLVRPSAKMVTVVPDVAAATSASVYVSPGVTGTTKVEVDGQHRNTFDSVNMGMPLAVPT